jgi:hypothetical protein
MVESETASNTYSHKDLLSASGHITQFSESFTLVFGVSKFTEGDSDVDDEPENDYPETLEPDENAYDAWLG